MERLSQPGADAPRTVDVREMLCAQALAVVAQALAGLQTGQSLAIEYSADDVRRDLVVWAEDRGHQVIEDGARLRLVRGP